MLGFALKCDIVSSIELKPTVQVSMYPNLTNNELHIEMQLFKMFYNKKTVFESTATIKLC